MAYHVQLFKAAETSGQNSTHTHITTIMNISKVALVDTPTNTCSLVR